MKKFAFALLLALSAAPVPLAFAQQGGEMVLVTPEGDLLGFTPEAGEVVVEVDAKGRNVLYDHYGNLVATEMPAKAYFARLQRLRGEPNGSGGFGELAVGEGNLDDYTGSIPEMRDQSSAGVESQPLPDLGSVDQAEQDLAALDPQLQDNQPLDGQPQDTLPSYDLSKKSSIEITALQVFLDREGASPGVIDGKMGSNVTKGIVAYEAMTGEKLDPNDTDGILERLRLSGGMPIVSYQITAADAAGPYVASIPEDYSQKAALPSMAYTSVTEALAERFHMDENYLKELNPGVDFTLPGSTIKVVNPGEPKKGAVARIVANKRIKEVQAFDASGNLIAAYPASIGSTDTPSPSGTHTVSRIALDPNYTYNPKINFKQGENDKVLTIPPGPNGPVGTVWIALDKPTYGIHGTPEPSKIGKTQSHGCIRLTNWDATELAKMVSPGTIVQFID